MNPRAGASALLVVLAVLSSGSRIGAAPQDQGPAEISAEALVQIEALLAEKESRTPAQQKIDSQLLYERRMEAGEEIAAGMWEVDTDLPYAGDGHLILDIRARPGGTLASRLPDMGIEVVSASDDGSDLRVHMDVDGVEMLAEDPDVVFIQPRLGAMISGQPATNLVAPTGQGSRISEGDRAHLAFAARGAFNVDGTGIKVGVLSDGVKNLAASQAAGDLGPVTVIGDPAPCLATAKTCDEGTAMLEIVHDLAPGAQLYFASALGGPVAFANNIRALRAAGCDIIVDDVFYFVETPFQDGQAASVLSPTNGGAVIQAVKDVVASGALYFSSAGNSGNLDAGAAGTWEGDFVDGSSAVPLSLGRLHNFGGQNYNTLTAANTDGSPITLFWSDPLGRSSNDYDLFRLNAAGTAIVASSTNIQSGTQDPIEQISQNITNPRLVIVKKTSAQPRFLHLETNRGRLALATAGATHGHSAVTGDGAYGVAASAAAAAIPGGFGPASLVESFSSDGPRRIFFNADGTPIAADQPLLAAGGLLLQKPDITAADGVSVSGVGGFGSPFSGTSDAAPHAAAIAALVKSANPGLSAAEVRAILTATAVDIQAPGIDRDSGVGIVMPREALNRTGIAGNAFVQVEKVELSENPGNSDGVVEAGEGAKLVITLKNYGVRPATAIAASVTSSTPGIRIAAPNTPAFADLAPMQALAAAAPTLVTLGSDVGCATTAAFRIDASYATGTPLAQTFAFPIGLRTITRAKSLDGSAPPDAPGIVGATGIQNVRLNRDSIVSSCTGQKATPALAPATAANGGPGPRRFDAYTINTCTNSAPSCATVTLEGANATNLFVAGYVPSFDPADIQQNHRGDPGSSAPSRTFSFAVPGGGSTFAVDVHDVVPGLAVPSGTAYTLTVSGICTGSCNPPNRPPTVRAKSVTVAAGAKCVADASVDDGSIDEDGDPLATTQSPPAPYSLGTTAVLLTKTDPRGAFGQATGAVTVVDQTAPAITGLAATPSMLSPETHRLVDVTVNFDAVDNCSAASCVLTVSDGQARRDDDADEPDVVVLDVHHVRLRAQSRHGIDRIYTLTLTCTDAAGNATVRTTTVVVPHDSDRSGKSK